MRARKLPYSLPLTDSLGRARGVGRSKVRHVSAVVQWIRSKVEKKRNGNYGGEEFMRQGFILECMIEEAFARYVSRGRKRQGERQRELIVDGLAMTPDFIDLGAHCIEEYKWTTLSMNRLSAEDEDELIVALESDFVWWLMQIMAYCYGCSVSFKRPMNRCRLIVLFAAGNYRDKRGPQPPMLVELTFTARELADNWHVLLTNAKAMEEEERAA